MLSLGRYFILTQKVTFSDFTSLWYSPSASPSWSGKVHCPMQIPLSMNRMLKLLSFSSLKVNQWLSRGLMALPRVTGGMVEGWMAQLRMASLVNREQTDTWIICRCTQVELRSCTVLCRCFSCPILLQSRRRHSFAVYRFYIQAQTILLMEVLSSELRVWLQSQSQTPLAARVLGDRSSRMKSSQSQNRSCQTSSPFCLNCRIILLQSLL